MALTLPKLVEQAKKLFWESPELRDGTSNGDDKFMACTIIEVKYDLVESKTDAELALYAYEMMRENIDVSYEETPNGPFRELVRTSLIDYVGAALQADPAIVAESTRRSDKADRLTLAATA